MEGGKKKSSFASDLFGEKDNPSSSSGIFGSIFAPPPPKVSGRETVQPFLAEKNGSGNQAWNPKTRGVSGGGGRSKDVGSYYQHEEKPQPFDHYSSSIYYGGQDVYTRPPQTAQNPVFTTFKDGGEDDSGGASRGNWWQESLYY